MRRSRDEIIQAFRATSAKVGRAPGSMLFAKLSRIPASEVQYYWPKHSDLVREAGGTPASWQKAIPDSVLFSEYARVCLHLQKLPTSRELQIATRQLKTRTHSVRSSRRPMDAFLRDFRTWLEESTDPELRSILELPGWNRSPARSKVGKRRAEIPVPTFHPFLPASLQYLDTLAKGERSPYDNPSDPIPTLFERRVGDALRSLGFAVDQLGQGKGRHPDCIAVSRPDGFALVVDAKVRSDLYAAGTEDRKFAEYLTTSAQRLELEGISRVYLLIVSSAFKDTDLAKLETHLSGTPVRSIVLMTAAALMARVETSIRDRHRFTLRDFEAGLFGNKIIAA